MSRNSKPSSMGDLNEAEWTVTVGGETFSLDDPRAEPFRWWLDIQAEWGIPQGERTLDFSAEDARRIIEDTLAEMALKEYAKTLDGACEELDNVTKALDGFSITVRDLSDTLRTVAERAEPAE